MLEPLSGPPASKTSHGGLFWGVPRGQVLGRALKPAFGLSPRHVQGSLSSESGERTELGLSTAFSQSGSVMTVTKEVASGRTESINDLSFIKESLKLHRFLCSYGRVSLLLLPHTRGLCVGFGGRLCVSV